MADKFTDVDLHNPFQLKTATAIADPVLVRMSAGKSHVIFIGSDMMHEHAGKMELFEARWVKSRHGFASFLTWWREPATGLAPQISLRRSGARMVVALHDDRIVSATADAAGFEIVDLTGAQYALFRHMSPRRLLAAGRTLCSGVPVRSAPKISKRQFRAMGRLKRAAWLAKLAVARLVPQAN